MKVKEYIRSLEDRELARFLTGFNVSNIVDNKYCRKLCPHRTVPDGYGGFLCDVDLERDGCPHMDEDMVHEWLNREMDEEVEKEMFSQEGAGAGYADKET